MMFGKLGAAGAVLLLVSCSTLPAPVALPAELGGSWRYVTGLPADDPLLSWKDWPDVALTIDAARGVWTVTPQPGARSVLPRMSRVIAANGRVLTLASPDRPRPFQIYWRLEGGRLEFWWGDVVDWLKPYVIYERF
jgi:hypothetical protein